MSVKYKFSRFTFWLFRFKTLARVKRIFSSVESPCFIRRSLFNYELCLDVSRSVTHQLLFLEGERFIHERFLLSKLLKPGMRVVDVGANIGYYLLLFEKYIGSEGEVICIEPSVENLPELKKNIEINRFVNVKLFDVAIGMDDGTTGLRVGINSGVVEKNQGSYQVALRKLDSLVTDKVDFLKIDVEGYEGQALKGAQEILNRDKPILFLEIHPSIIPEFGFSVGQILDDLSSIYKETTCYECQPNENIDFIKKISLRYIDKDPLVKVKNIPQYMSKCAEGEITRPFWAICKS
ncbi:MAG: hypothetical protein A3D13_10550 [Planctomycetes bacterium RIFCSPHIGHO2_02_FULL_40_12]|nr:MAG: hypothetical protein A3D13_10550 [Planctomycetes bacterium RIFCSPHIGHO2_02_FULL_40_12]